MKRSSRTTAAMRNHRFRMDARLDAIPSHAAGGMVARGADTLKTVDPDMRRLIDEALARRQAGRVDGDGR